MDFSNIFGGAFDPSGHEPSRGMDTGPLPVGVYTAEITNAEVKPLKSGKGTGLSLEFTIIDPAQHEGRKVWQNLNVQHENEQAQRIALSDLASICRALNIDKLGNENELFGRVLRIRTKIRAASGEYPARAEVAGYDAAGVQTPPPPAPPAAGRPSSPPWAKK